MTSFEILLEKISKLKDKKIVTVTLNPVVDRTLWVSDFFPGKTMRVDKTMILAAGKGVNVSRALKMLGLQTIATGILPEDGSSYYLSLLKKESIKSNFLIVNTEGTVRTNITILSNTTTSETHLREKGPILNNEIFNQFKDKLIGISNKADAIVFSGSLPLGLSEDSYKKLIEDVKSSVVFTALDSSGSALKYGVKSAPTLIKPNYKESREILGFSPDSTQEILRAMDKFNQIGIPNILLSLGEKGLIYSNGKDTVKAMVKINGIVNSVGSGDAALAGGLAAIMAWLPQNEVAAFSCAMGAANALSYGACIINPLDLKRLYKSVELEIYK